MPKLTYLGHAAFFVEGKAKILIDPFLTGNPKAAAKAGDFTKLDAILLTHGHADHLGDTVAIAKKTGTICVATFELALWLGAKGCAVADMHVGGSRAFPWGRVKLTLAHHGNSVQEEDGSVRTLGAPAGFLLEMDGKTLYHAGDTGLFEEMETIGRGFGRGVDVALLPIGDNYTMGPEDAAEAAKKIGARITVPMHYNTFPVIEQDPNVFAAFCEKTGQKVRILEPGSSLEY